MANLYNGANLYYGNGECSIESAAVNIAGVQIFYEGSILTEKMADENCVLMNNNNQVLIFKLNTGNKFLSDLFIYAGEFKITSVIVADEFGKEVYCQIKRVLDYSELLNSNAEDMTTNSEDINVNYKTSKRKILSPQKTINNLNTSDIAGASLFLINGEQYSGNYHIHLNNNSAMTGAEHSNKSEDLYFKQGKDGILIDKLIPTKNLSHIPPINILQGKPRQSRPSVKIREPIKGRKKRKKIRRGVNPRL